VSEAQHLSDDDQMIASLHAVVKFAIQPRRGIGKYRAVGDAGHPRQIGEFVGRFRSERPGQVLLVLAKDIDAEMVCSGEGGIAACALVNADEDERRVERHTRKGVGGKASWYSL
jgi:hypothetical protein